jgi:Phage P22-like portal protein
MAEAQQVDLEFDPRIEEAKEFLRFSNTAETNNRAEALDDLRFAAGDQWPVEIQNSRSLEARPCLTINKLDAYCRQIVNQIKQQRPRIKVHGMNNEADAKVAEILQGITRHIELQSDADFAYTNAADFAVRMGWGFFRLNTRYVSDDSFDQEIYIDAIKNPFTVYYDPNSIMPDGSDAEKCLITEVISKDLFRKMYPDADDGQGFRDRGTGDDNAEWVQKEDIRIAEYFYKEYVNTHLVLLSDGSHVFEDELPPASMLEEMGLEIISKRKTVKKQVKWCKLTAMQVLEEGTWAGKYIPVIPVYGQETVVQDKAKKYGLVRMAKDPQRMYNFWTTSITESVALAPKAKWIMAEGQDEGHENEWSMANVKSMSYLRYKQTDINGQPAPPPQRMQPEPPPSGIMAAAQSITQDLQAVVGIYDPSQLPTGMISGKAIQGQQMQVDMTNFHFYDNLTRSIAYCGRQILDLAPKIYDSERVMRIIGDDGKAELVTINQRKFNEEKGVYEILNNVTVGEYDVDMDTGPGYNSKRAEAADSMIQMLQVDPALMQQAGDLIFRNLDFPGADIIADRLAAANPLAQIDDKSDIPPKAQMMIAQLQQQLQQAGQQIQMLTLDHKYGATVAEQKDRAMLQRTAMQVAGKRYDTELRTDTTAQDTVVKTEAQKEIERMKAQIAILLAQMDHTQARLANEETTERAI